MPGTLQATGDSKIFYIGKRKCGKEENGELENDKQ